MKKRDLPGFVNQKRPEKVKQIYKALKREHPELSAKSKARIASSVYSKMLSKKSHVDRMVLQLWN